MEFVALCAIGAEKILGTELKLLGFKIAPCAPGRVLFMGGIDSVYRANVCLRTSERVFIRMAYFDAFNFDDLFEGCYSAPWEEFLKKDLRIIVDKVRIFKSSIQSERNSQKILQKALYTKLCDVWKMSSMPESGEVCKVRVYIEKNKVEILLDTSGEPLHKRGYRIGGFLAPLRETTAAVLLSFLHWKRKTALLDPFCGSGTILIEAMLFAHAVSPGLFREFSYKNLAFFNSKIENEIRKIETTKIRTDVLCRIFGSDIDSHAISTAKKNAQLACKIAEKFLVSIGRNEKIMCPTFEKIDFRNLKAQFDFGTILCNPPYGERLGNEDEAKLLYGEMSLFFREFPSWQMGFLTNCESFQNCIGKKSDVVKKIKAGNLDTMLYIYK